MDICRQHHPLLVRYLRFAKLPNVISEISSMGVKGYIRGNIITFLYDWYLALATRKTAFLEHMLF